MLQTVIVILAVILLLAGLWIFAIASNKVTEERKAKFKPFESRYIAHRGFFNNKKSVDGQPPKAPENSLEAFRLAVDRDYGIELDVQLTKDDKLVVFHDASLKRMCGEKGHVLDYSYDQLKEFSLLGSDQKIPLFDQVLQVVDGRIPMIIEVKPEGDCAKTARILNDHLKDYQGVYCMESFHPKAVRWYRKNRPDIIRGQLSERFPKKTSKRENLAQKMLASLLFNFLGRPDFIAYNHKHKNQLSYRLCRRLNSVYNVAWTIRSQEELEAAKDVFTIFIFDSFQPK